MKVSYSRELQHTSSVKRSGQSFSERLAWRPKALRWAALGGVGGVAVGEGLVGGALEIAAERTQSVRFRAKATSVRPQSMALPTESTRVPGESVPVRAKPMPVTQETTPVPQESTEGRAGATRLPIPAMEVPNSAITTHL